MKESALKFINDNGPAITIIASALVAIFAAISTVLTAVLAIENRRLRLAGLSPEVVAYLEPHPDGNGAVNFVLANIGQGPAMNVKLELNYDEADFRSHDVHLLNEPGRAAFTVLPQGERRSYLFGVGYVLFGKEQGGSGKILKPFVVRTSYKNVFGKRGESTHQIDITQFTGLAGMGSKPAIREVAESLKRMEGHLGKIAKQSDAFSNWIDSTTIKDEWRKKSKGPPTP
ncbi:conserved exported hypothetical protein [Mesorhizobium sp. ORS 3359]|nr:conserved exported hypothetical protein [Mesorhizobium sp. ORS 3359]